jgi:hypothetical protein
MQERVVIPSPALLAGEDEGEGTEHLGAGRGRSLRRRVANRNPHLNPLPRVVRERRTIHLAEGARSVLRDAWRRPWAEPAAGCDGGMLRPVGSRRRFTRRASAAARSAAEGRHDTTI